MRFWFVLYVIGFAENDFSQFEVLMGSELTEMMRENARDCESVKAAVEGGGVFQSVFVV